MKKKKKIRKNVKIDLEQKPSHRKSVMHYVITIWTLVETRCSQLDLIDAAV